MLLILTIGVIARPCTAAGPDDKPGQASANVLTEPEWDRVEQSSDRALAWLAGQQKSDGSFPSKDMGQPAVTSLCVMAFLVRGHTPGYGPYGDTIKRAIDFVLTCQKNNGLIAYVEQRPDNNILNSYHCGMYNHGISGVMLCEAYGMVPPEQAARIRPVLDRALALTVNGARVQKHNFSQGGWRYSPVDPDSDLSITCWQLMFLRAAQNVGYEIPVDVIDGAVGFVQLCAVPEMGGGFSYSSVSRGQTPAMCGAGILALSLSGLHETQNALLSQKWILDHYLQGYKAYNAGGRYHYEIYHITMGMYQLGGDGWRQWYQSIVNVLLSNQSSNGSWQKESGPPDSWFGNSYTTALAVQVLGAPFQLVPIYQR